MASLITLGQVIDRSFEHCRQHLKELLAIILWIVVAAVPSVAGKLIALIESNPNITTIDWFAISLTVLGTLTMAIISMWVYINLILVVADQAAGKTINLKRSYTASWKAWPQYLLLSLLMAAAVIAMASLSLPGLILIFTSAIKNNPVMSVIGPLLLILGGIFSLYTLLKYSLPFAFAPYILLLEKSSAIDAIKNSLKLVKGRWLTVFMRFVIPKFIYTLIYLAISYASFAMFQVLFSVVANTSLFLYLILATLNLFLSVFISVMVTPLIVANDYYLYDSLRKTRG